MSLLEEEYAQAASTVSTLRAILDGYPLSTRIFLELLANSDDAGASKQVFVSDLRNHATEGLYSEGLARSQGAAFMAFNDAVLKPQDWKALKSIHDSSKVVDESKIGKYGVGFRSTFNLTDCPQILSDQYLAIFDPLGRHLGTEGRKIDLGHILSTFPNQLAPFGFFMKDGLASPFPGTVIRCPFRSVPSGISDQIVQGEVISELFKEFIDKELEISCLFLRNVKCIEIYEIASTGATCLLAKMTISRSDPIHSPMSNATVELDRNHFSVRKEWQIVQKEFSRDEAIDILLQLPGYNLTSVTRTLQGAKFSPEVKIAVDTTGSIHGRLFTHLPLPIFTGFPVHIHALFGIDTSRAHLRRAGVGLTSGSQDHVKVQWNRMLFQTFVPRTWSYLLQEMVSRALVSDVFSIWPPERSSGEIECYYTPLSGELVDALLAANAAVWPVYELQNQFRSLEVLVVAPPTERECVLQALARAGLSLTRPPRYIFDLLCHLENVSILDPDVAHRLLLEQADKIAQASEKDQELLLEYLLSTKNILNICNLPLVPVANGEKVTIFNAPAIPVYTILTRSEFDVFQLCDDSAIPLHRLPRHVADTLIEMGPRSLNVQTLTVPRIVEYLSQYSDRLNSDLSESRINPSAVRWLSNFWEWMDSYEHKDELFAQIRHLPLLPSMKGLRKAESTLFKLRDEHPAYTMGYLALGVPFFPREVSEGAHRVLQRCGRARLISDIPALLESMASTHTARLSHLDYENILKHLASRMDEKITQENIQSLRNLPLFPILASTNSSCVVTNWTAIPQGHSIRSVGRPRFVPVIDGVSFVGLDSFAPTLVKFLEPSYPHPMSENDLIELAVEKFTTQPEYLQLDFLRHIAANRTRIIQDIINKLCAQAFVLAEDGIHHVPGDIVDPNSNLGQLYIGCPAHLPSKGDSCVEIVRCLRSLGLLRAQLNPEIVAERVEYISSRHTSDEALSIARNFLPLLGSSNVDFSQVQGVAGKKWLPTNLGLCSADECRHAAFTPLALFDRVLGILEPFPVSPSLQTALCWDKPLRIDLLIRQLDQCLLDSEHSYDAVVEVVKEFGRREWSDEDFESLKRTVKDRQWIPTTGNVLADYKSSVFNFSTTMINSGFYQIRTDLKAENLLQRMGCTDNPTPRSILGKLHSLNQNSNHIDPVGTSISLLRSLPDDIATREEHAELLIPDKDSQLRPVTEIFYNDIGENCRLVNNDGHFIAHPSLDESLVRKLGLNRLGLRYAELRNVGPNMGQAPITTVRRTLEQYTNKQFLVEFLANAVDANATEFMVAVNLTTVREEQKLHVLSPAMEYLCRLPSLVVHNNSLFTPQDFEGICHTSVGGKEGRPDTIGEFGLGVLTMFHFTDLAMVISGSRVLFLDPSKKHLPLTDCASLILQLEHVQQFYKDHLIAIDGLFDFSMSSQSYNGTLFVLPLRVSDGITHEFWSPERITSEILEPFRTIGGDCLLFTGIQAISCITRGEEGAVTQHWSFQARKTPVMGSETGYVVTDIEIMKSVKSTDSTARWKTVTTSRSKDQLPSEFQTEDSLLRKPSVAGLGARLDRSSDGHSFTFFSSLPLSTPTTLPMHVMASFKLSSDRRQIRLDRLEELQTRYNTWLLEELIPPLYLFFLEHLLRFNDEHYRLRWPSDKGDTLSNHIVNSFYSSKHLKTSSRDLFSGLYSPLVMLTPHTAFLHVDTIRHIMDRLRPQCVVELPTGPRELAERAGLRTVDPDFVKNEIMRNPGAITSGIDFQMILNSILYLARQTNSSNIIHGLPILPLENESFGVLDTRGTGIPYYLWKPKKNQSRKHNFDESRFVHPKMKTTELERYNLNISQLKPPTFKRFVADKLSTFSESSISSAQEKWIDSFWDSWEEYTALGINQEDIAPFTLVKTTLPSLVSLDQCKKGDVFLVKGEQSHDLRTCFRELGLHVVHVDSGQTPVALREILEIPDKFPPLKLRNVIPVLKRMGASIPDLFGRLDDVQRIAFAEWARENIADIPEHQISFAQTLPVWLSAGKGAPRALRPASEVQLLPKNLTLQDAADFMAGYVAEDPSLVHLKIEHMALDELPRRVLPPDVLDLDMTALLHYKEFYKKCASDSRRNLLVPTSASTFKDAKDLFKREPLFTAIYPEDSSFFVHPVFEDFEKQLIEYGLQIEENLDMKIFKTCAESLDVNGLTAVPRAREVFRAFTDILPTRVTTEPHKWRELDEIRFIPRRMNTVRKLSELDKNETGLEIPLEVKCLDPIVSPNKVVKEGLEAVVWSQRACFEMQPGPSLYAQYPDLGMPDSAEVMDHLRYLSNITSLSASQRRILLHDVKEVYKYFVENFKRLKGSICLTLRDEPLFLNIDGDEEGLNWVKGSSLAINGHLHEGAKQGVRAFLRPFEEILDAAGAHTVPPSYIRGRNNQDSESGISSIFDQLRRDNALTDVVFKVDPTGVPKEPLFAHRTLLAVFSEPFRKYLCADPQESRNVSTGCPLTISVHYSWECVRSFLDHIYTRSKGGKDFPLDLLLEILDLSNTYKVMDLFDDVQSEIIERKLLVPDTVDKIKAEAEKHQAGVLWQACTQFESEDRDYKASKLVANICEV